MLNLLTNAAYALGQVRGDATKEIRVSVKAEGQRVVLRVADSGPGIAPEVAAQLFDPFFTTKPPGEGTGLGLFLSYGIAETHGGTLTVDSVPRQGATFALSLPPPPGHAAPRRVLVVDDDPAVRRLVTVLFAHDGHTVDTAADGMEALRMAREAEYDLVLSDRRAAADGEPFLTALLREHPAWKGRNLIAASDRPGMTDETAVGIRQLKKPFNLRDLRPPPRPSGAPPASRPCVHHSTRSTSSSPPAVPVFSNASAVRQGPRLARPREPARRTLWRQPPELVVLGRELHRGVLRHDRGEHRDERDDVGLVEIEAVDPAQVVESPGGEPGFPRAAHGARRRPASRPR